MPSGRGSEQTLIVIAALSIMKSLAEVDLLSLWCIQFFCSAAFNLALCHTRLFGWNVHAMMSCRHVDWSQRTVNHHGCNFQRCYALVFGILASAISLHRCAANCMRCNCRIEVIIRLLMSKFPVVQVSNSFSIVLEALANAFENFHPSKTKSAEEENVLILCDCLASKQKDAKATELKVFY